MNWASPIGPFLLILCGSLCLVHSASAQEETDQQIIRVSLFDEASPQSIELTAETPLSLAASSDGPPFATLEPGTSVEIREREGELAIHLDDQTLYMTRIVIHGDEARFTLSSPDDLFSHRTYVGDLHIYRAETRGAPLRLVNHVPLENYVASVVSSEYGFDDVEGARAMAVLARTYALYADARHEEYDHVDHTMSQVYHGAQEITDAALEATRSTAGQVLTYNNELIQAVYFSSSGGHTANNEDLWQSNALPYLRGREDPYDANSPHTSWTARVDRPELLRRLSQQYGFSVRGFLMGDRSDDGRLKEVTLLGTSGERLELQANEFRLFANRQLPDQGIRSTMFDARRDGEVYIFEGSGFGHGVGLSQYGALEMSERGYTYDEILSYYFTDVSLQGAEGTITFAEERPDDELPVAEDQPDLREPVPPARDTTSTRTRIGW